MEVQAKINTIEVSNLFASIKRKQKKVIGKALNRVSNMAKTEKRGEGKLVL